MIIGEIEVKDENKDQRILCSYEEFCRLDNRKISEQYGNEKQLKENIEIEIDGKKFRFVIHIVLKMENIQLNTFKKEIL